MSKRIPEEAKNYSITDIELNGLAINTESFAQLMRKQDSDPAEDGLV